MDSLFLTYKKSQEIISEPKKSDHFETGHSSQYLFSSCHHHSLTTIRLTCEGNLDEPNFSRKLKKLISKLKILVSNDKKPIKVTKVEPWNSVRVTLNLPNDAAQRLRQLAEHGDANLRELGILSIQLEGQQVISLRLSNQNSANNANSLSCNIDQVNSLSNINSNNNISLVNQNKEIPTLKDSCSNEKYPFGQVNGVIGDESSNSSSSNSFHEQTQISSDRSNFPKIRPFQLGSSLDNVGSNAQSLPSTSIPPPSYVASQQQKVYFSQSQTNRASNSLLLPNTRPNPAGSSQTKTDFLFSSTNTSNSGEVSSAESNVPIKKTETISGVASNTSTTSQVMVQPICLQTIPLSSCNSNMSSGIINQFTSSQSSVGFSSNIRNGNPSHFNGPMPLLISSTSQQTFISSQKSVPQTSNIQSLTQPVKQTDSVSHSSIPAIESNIKSLQQPFDHNANYVNNSTTAPNILPLYQPLSTNASTQQQLNASIESEVKLQPNVSNQTHSPALASQADSSSDILGSSVDAVDDEDLLASVTATGANSIDFNSFTDLNDLNLLSMLEEMESANETSTASSLEIANSNTNSSNESNQHSESSTPPVTVTVTSSVAPVSATIDEFRSPNVIAPQSTQTMPFFIAQQQQQQQVSAKIGTPGISGGQPILINSSTGAVLSQAQHFSQQIIASTTTAASLPQSTLYPFTSMQHASLFTNKQQVSPQQPSSPRHVIVPVRQIPAVCAATSQQVSPPTQQQQTVPMVRALQPTVTSSAGELIVRNSGPQQNLYRPSTQLTRQQLPTTATNASLTLPNKPQQQQIVIRQSVPYSATQQVTNSSNTGQQNTVALSSPLLVNLLQSDVQPSNSHQQQHQFVAQPGTQQIRLITPSGAHTDGTQVMMMVRVSSAPQGGTTTQLINPATGSIVATVPSSQVVTSIASPVVDQQITLSQANDSSSVSTTKPKKPRKSRSKKNQTENGKSDGSVQTSMTMTSLQQVTSSISSGAITSIPLSLATSNSSRLQSPVSTIFTFPTSSIAQTLKLQTSSTNPQQTLLTGQAGQHLFNQKRVQPVVMIAATNPSLLSQVGTSSIEANASVSNAIVTSTGAFIFTNVAASSLSGNTSTSTTTTAGLHLSGNRKQIFLATKSNSFPVSSALSSGAIKARFTNNPTPSSSQSLVSSPVKFVSQAASSPVPICVAVSSNSSSLPSIDNSLANLGSKSSLGNVASNVQSIISTISSNVASTVNVFVSTASITSVSNSSVSPIVTSMIKSSPMVSSPTISNLPINKAALSAILPSDSLSLNSSQVLVTATKSITPAAFISGENISKNIMVPINVSTSVATNSVLLNKLTPPNASILASSPKILTSANFSQFSNKSPLKTFSFPITQPTNKQVLPIKLVDDLKEVSSLGVSGDSSFMVKNVNENIDNLFPTESKISISKCENIETFLSSAINEPKKASTPKAVAKSTFKFSLADVLEEGSSKLDSDFLSGDDDTDRMNELSAPISPSYFLAPPSAFENKPSEPKETNSASFSLDFESKNSFIDNTTSKGDLINTPLVNSQQVLTSIESVYVEPNTSIVSKPSFVESVTRVSTFPTLSLTTTTVSTLIVTSTESNKTMTTSTATAVTKSNETIQSKSNSFDSISYFLSKHNYSQDLPDHILEDDEDDSDADDFGLGIFPTRLLSGRIGTIGGSGNLSISSQNSSSLSTATTIPKLSDTFDSLSTSITTNSIFPESKLNEDLFQSSSNDNNHSTFQSETTSTDISDFENHSNTEIEKDAISSSFNLPLVKDNSSNDNLSTSTTSQASALFHRIMNGDISTHSLSKSKSNESTSQMNTTSMKSVFITTESKNLLSTTPLRQYQVASKSYPDMSNVGNLNMSNMNVVLSNKVELTSPVEQLKTSITTDAQELTNLVVGENKQAPSIKESLKQANKSSKIRKPPSSSVTNKNPSTANKSRRKATTTVTTMPQTLVVTDSLFQSTNTLNAKSELHSLLASPSVTTSKSNMAMKTNISTVESMSSSSDPISTSNSSTESQTSRPLYITFKQPTPQAVVSNSLQPLSSQASQQDISPSTSTSSATTLVKVLVPGVNISGATGNKVLTIAPSGTSQASSAITGSSNSGQTLSQVMSTTNSSDQSQNKSQNQAITPMVGRYILTTPGQPYGQFVVVKSMNFDSNNASVSNSAQLKFIAASPSSKLPSVSVAGTSQPLFMVAGSSGGQTLLSVKPNTQAISSNEPSMTINAGNEQQTIESENEKAKKMLARKTNTTTNLQTASTIINENSNTQIVNKISAFSVTQVESKAKVQTNIVRATIEPTNTKIEDKALITKESNLTALASSFLSKTEDKSLSSEHVSLSSSIPMSNAKSSSSVTLVSSASETSNIRNDFESAVGPHDQNIVKIVEQTTLVKSMPKSILKNDSFELSVNKLVSDKSSVQNILTNSIVLPKEKNETISVPSTTPLTVQLMLPTSNESNASATSTSPSNVVKLRVDPPRIKEAGNDLFIGIKGNINANIANKRPLLMPKPLVTVHPHVSQSSNSHEITQTTVFATKSGGASFSSSKTIPTILRQSKRKADTLYQISNSESQNISKLPQQIDQSNSEYCESPELETSIGGVSLIPSIRTNKNFCPTQANEPNSMSPIIEFVDDNNSEINEIGQTVMPKPRKRARKSKVTTIQQPVSVNDLGTSLLLSDYNTMPIEIDTEMSESDVKRSSMSASPRVLRNTISTTPTPIPNKAAAASNANKRTQRNRNTLIQNLQIVSVSSTQSTSTLSDSIILANSIPKIDKSRKLREATPNSNSARQTRSNRNRNKSEQASTMNSTNEIMITDNAVDESPHLASINNSDLEVITLPMENSHHLSVLNSDVLMGQQSSTSSHMNNFSSTLSPSSVDQRTHLILESGNSNSSTASSSSSNSLLQRTQRPRKQLPSPTTTTTTKPSLRSNSATDTLTTPMTPNKRRRVANK